MLEQNPFTRLTGAENLEAFPQNVENPVPTHSKYSYTESLKMQAKEEQNKSNKWTINISSIFYSFGNKKNIVTTLQ